MKVRGTGLTSVWTHCYNVNQGILKKRCTTRKKPATKTITNVRKNSHNDHKEVCTTATGASLSYSHGVFLSFCGVCRCVGGLEAFYKSVPSFIVSDIHASSTTHCTKQMRSHLWQQTVHSGMVMKRLFLREVVVACVSLWSSGWMYTHRDPCD